MKAYFIGIVGKAMGQIAKALKGIGWEVLGSDQEKVYPPLTTYLEQNNIKYFKGYRAEQVPKDADLVVVGRSALIVDPNNPEYQKAKELGLKILSYPELLRDFLIKQNSIVVAGTYGKTTVSAILTWIFIKAGFDPSYMIGGVPININDGAKITKSSYSIVEGDEPPSLLPGSLSKFLYYKPKYLLLTAVLYDHPEIFKSENEYQKAFTQLISLIPDEGVIVYNLDAVPEKILQSFPGKKISYSRSNINADCFIKNIVHKGNNTEFTLVYFGIEYIFNTELIGKHNLENLTGAVCLSLNLGIDIQPIKEGINTFKGVKTRMEYLGQVNGRYIYWDYSQHPLKVKSALDGLRENYEKGKIFCVFDPSMTGLKYEESLDWYPGAFDKADRVIVSKVSFLKENSENKVSGKDIVEAISETQKNVSYEPIDEKIILNLLNNSKDGDIIVFMSSGGERFFNLIQSVILKLNIKN